MSACVARRPEGKRRRLTSRARCCQAKFTYAAPLTMAHGHALDRTLAGGAKHQKVEQRPEDPGCEREGGRREEDGAASEKLDDRARLCALGGRECCQLGHILWMLGNFEGVERAAHASARLHLAQTAREC